MSQKNKFILVFLLGAITFWGYNKYAFPNVEKRIQPNKYRVTGIIGAMEEEVKTLEDSMTLDSIYNIAGLEFYKGKLNSKQVVIVKSGIGKVNSAVATQILIDRFYANEIINSGVAGGLNKKLQIGDVVIAKSLRYNDFNVTAFGYKIGDIPRMDTSIFYSDRMMMAKILENGRKLGYRISYGNISSGDQFVNHKQKDRILELFNSDAVEMEGASIAHVCHINKIPFVIVRAISDKADGESPKIYAEFEKEAAKKSAKLIMESLKD